MTTWRRKIEEYEADLYTVQTTWWAKLLLRSKGGEMEIKHYEDGAGAFKLGRWRTYPHGSNWEHGRDPLHG